MARVSPLLLLLGWAAAQSERRPTLGASADHRPPPHTLANEGDLDAIANEIRSDLKEIKASTPVKRAAATNGPRASYDAPRAGTLMPLDVDAIDNDPDHVLHDLRKLALELEALAPDERPSLEELERERSAMVALVKLLKRARGAVKRAGASKEITLAFSGNANLAVAGGFEFGSIGFGLYLEINVEAGGTGTATGTVSAAGGGVGLSELLKDALRRALGEAPREAGAEVPDVLPEDQAFFSEPVDFVGTNPEYGHDPPTATEVSRSRTSRAKRSSRAQSTEVFDEFAPAEEEGEEDRTPVEFPKLAQEYGVTASTSTGVGVEVEAKLLARISVSLVGGLINYFCDFHTAVAFAADTPAWNALNDAGINPALSLDARTATLLSGFETTFKNFKNDACKDAEMYFFVRRTPGAAFFLRGRYAGCHVSNCAGYDHALPFASLRL